jgi:hypothetical protein
MDVKNMDIREQYRERAIQFANEWKSEFPNVSDHNIEMMVSIMATRDKTSYPGGGFVEAVCSNDLVGAVTRADSDNIRVIKLLALTHKQCYL